MRLVALAFAAVLVVTPAAAEDTAGVLAAMPNRAASERYLKELCARVERSETAYVAALDTTSACRKQQPLCRDFRRLNIEEEAAKHVRTAMRGEHATAAAVYRAKYDRQPPACAALDSDRVLRKLEEITGKKPPAEAYEPPGGDTPMAVNPDRASCESACRADKLGAKCYEVCRWSYP